MLLLAAILSIASPSGPGAAEPHLTPLRGGGVAMSWLEPTQAKRHALKFATLTNGKWSSPRVIAERADFFVNWADFPSIVEDAKGTLFAHWLQKSGSSTYAYDVHVTSSSDGGKTWRAPRLVNRDGKSAEHGFVSMVALQKGGVGVVWLDGREMSEGQGHGHGEGAMMLRYVEIDAALNAARETMLDARVCECCGTGMAMTSRGPLVVYRDRSEGEIRDIGFIRFAANKWTAPSHVHADDWKINGCPVNGPQLDARDDHAVVAWFTSAGNRPEVRVAFSRDAGGTWSKPLRVDTGQALGRVDVMMLADGSALVTWIQGEGANAGIFARRVFANGRVDAPMKIGSTTAARAAGFPRTTVSGDAALFAWTDPAAKQIRLAQLFLR